MNKEPRVFIQQTVDVPEVLKFNTPDQTLTYKGNVAVNVSLTGGTGKKLTKIYYKLESDVLKDAEWIAKTNVTNDVTTDYTFTVDSTSYVSATVPYVKIFVKCENEYGETSSEKNVTVKIDNYSPTVTFTYPNAGSGIYAQTQIRGNAEDSLSGVKSLYVGYFTTVPDMTSTYDTEAKLDAAVSLTPALGKWIKIENPKYAWDVTVDTTVLYNDTVEHSFDLYVAAVDSVGNVGYKSANYKINQSLDIPRATIEPVTSGQISSAVRVKAIDENSGVTTNADGLKLVYWFIGKTSVDFGSGVDKAPADYNTWNTYTGSADSKGGVVDLSATKPTTKDLT
ncbi:MAG TPA: hypothetical protein PLO89_12560, partial [Spirochaetota bacterium]|nr:hypothetical protein [Spirochaetota bacterium]